MARELPDGTLQLIDGHLRAETTPDVEVPVLVLDLDEREATKLLALHDPLAGMAEANEEAITDLLNQVETESDAVKTLIDQMLGETESAAEDAESEDSPLPTIPEAFQVVIECRDEAEQQTVFERMTGEGYECRLLTL